MSEKTTMMETVVLSMRIVVPCRAECGYLEDLAQLPESSPELLMRRSGMDEAMRRLSAARLAIKEAEEAAMLAGKKLRHLVDLDWKPSEIPQSVKDGLNVW